MAKIAGASRPASAEAEDCRRQVVTGESIMQGFFHFPAAESLSAAVLRRRPGGLDRACKHQGLRARHGRRRHHRRRGALGLGFALWREARAEQLHQVPVLLPLHVWRRAARRTVLRQQPGGRRSEVHVPCRGVERARPGAGRARRQAVRAAAGRGRRHARGLADHVGGHRLGRTGDHFRRRHAAGRHEAGGSVRR